MVNWKSPGFVYDRDPSWALPILAGRKTIARVRIRDFMNIVFFKQEDAAFGVSPEGLSHEEFLDGVDRTINKTSRRQDNTSSL